MGRRNRRTAQKTHNRVAKAQDENPQMTERNFFSSLARGRSDSALIIDDTAQGYMLAYEHIVHVRRCVNLIASAIASAVPYLHNTVTDEDIYDHPALDPLHDKVTAPGLDPEDTIDRVERDLIYWGIFGHSYWGFPQGTRDHSDPKETYLLNPLWVTPTNSMVSPSLGTIHYQPTGTGGGTTYGPGDWIQPKTFFPRDPYKGLSPIKALIQKLATASFADSYARDYMENGAFLGGAVTFPESVGLNPDQRDELGQAMKEKSGPGQRGSWIIVDRGAVLTPFGDSMKDAAIELPDAMAMEATGEVYGVPSFFLSTKDTAYYATANTAKASLWDETLYSTGQRYYRQLTAKLLPYYRDTENLVYRMDTSMIPALQSKRLERAKEVALLCGVPILSPDEARELAAYEARGGENAMLWKPAGYSPDGIEPLGKPE